MTKTTRKKLNWSTLKGQLVEFDRPALLGLVKDLYALSKDNQAFLHARFGQGDDILKPYKDTISRWASPDLFRNQDISISKAKKAIADYKKAIGRPDGLAELTVFYCESCTDFLSQCGMDYAAYYSSLVRMFEQALKAVRALDPERQPALVERLDRVRHDNHNWGWGVGEDMDALMVLYGFSEE